MTPEQFLDWQAKFFGECVVITKAKNNDYSPDSVILGEVVETAFELGINVPQVLAVHLRKHWSALTTYFQGQKPLASETVDGRLHDAMNYLVFLALWEKERKTIVDAMYTVVERRPCECKWHIRFKHGPDTYPPHEELVDEINRLCCARCKFITHLVILD